MPTYTYSNLRQRVNAGIKNKIGILIDERETINEAVRQVISDIDLRSTKRKSQLVPNLFTDVFKYKTPTDFKDFAFIDIVPQAQGVRNKPEYRLTTHEDFQRGSSNVVALTDDDMVKTLLVRTTISDDKVILGNMDSLTGDGGTWEVVGDGENLRNDEDNFIKQSASLRFDISSGGTSTAGIKNTGLSSQDLSDYFGGNGAAFIWVYINTTDDLNSFTLEFGSSESAYYSKTVTAQHDDTAFVNGWNLLRFPIVSYSTTGSPDNTAIVYASIYMNKETTKISETDYRFDSLTFRIGEINNLWYYSKYGWQGTDGTYKENSTVDEDLLNADTDEFNLFVRKGVELAGEEVDEIEAANRAREKYILESENYQMINPSERKLVVYDYAQF